MGLDADDAWRQRRGARRRHLRLRVRQRSRNHARLQRLESGRTRRVQAMMRKVFYPVSHAFLTRIDTAMDTHYWANWGIANIACVQPSACCATTPKPSTRPSPISRPAAATAASGKPCTTCTPATSGNGRKPAGANTLGIALTGAICEMAWNQGIDLYGYDNNRFLAGAEYVAKANLKQADGTFYTVPFVTYQNSAGVTQTQFSTGGRGDAWAALLGIGGQPLHQPQRSGGALYQARCRTGGTGRRRRQLRPQQWRLRSACCGTLTCTLDPGTPPQRRPA